jgi:hypothetical protein
MKILAMKVNPNTLPLDGFIIQILMRHPDGDKSTILS